MLTSGKERQLPILRSLKVSLITESGSLLDVDVLTLETDKVTFEVEYTAATCVCTNLCISSMKLFIQQLQCENLISFNFALKLMQTCHTTMNSNLIIRAILRQYKCELANTES